MKSQADAGRVLIFSILLFVLLSVWLMHVTDDALARGSPVATVALGAASLIVPVGTAVAYYRWRMRIQRRPPRGPGCKRCGYDLTGNVSGVCPECGTIREAA